VANGDDVTDAQGAQNLVQAALDAFGELHVLINNAGSCATGCWSTCPTRNGTT
jgi:NAD(P)-dependent dehydrogenase (short-subunit alcohol dehydrogenase family)